MRISIFSHFFFCMFPCLRFSCPQYFLMLNIWTHFKRSQKLFPFSLYSCFILLFSLIRQNRIWGGVVNSQEEKVIGKKIKNLYVTELCLPQKGCVRMCDKYYLCLLLRNEIPLRGLLSISTSCCEELSAALGGAAQTEALCSSLLPWAG